MGPLIVDGQFFNEPCVLEENLISLKIEVEKEGEEKI